MSRWFRAYSETLNDPKIQTLSLAAFKAWHNALYLASAIDSKDGDIGTLDDVSFAFRETKEAVSSAFHELVERGLIETVDETFHISAWKKRQFKSDTSTDRVRKHRRDKKRSSNVTVTAPDTDTETDKSIPLSNDNGPKPSDSEFWSSAKSYLASEIKNPGALIGKWCKQYTKADTAQAITAAQIERPAVKVPYIEATLRRQHRAEPAVPL